MRVVRSSSGLLVRSGQELTQRRGGLVLTALVCSVSLAAFVGVSAAAARDAGAARTLVTTTGPIRAFAQDGTRIAWIGSKWDVRVRKAGGGKTTLVGTARPFGALAKQALPAKLALGGKRVLWTRSGGGNQLETDIYLRTAGDRRPARAIFMTSADTFGGSGAGGFFGAAAGADSTLAYSTVLYQCIDLDDCTELAVPAVSPLDGTFRVAGTWGRFRVPGVHGAAALAVSGGRIATLPAASQVPVTQISGRGSPRLAAPASSVDVRDAVTGRLISQFTPKGTVRALALSGSIAAVVDEQPGGTKAIERYSAATGKLIGKSTVPAGSALGVSGRTLVYAIDRKIEAMDAVTGIRRQLALSSAPPIGLSVTGHRVAWAVNVHGHGSVLALTLP